MGAGDGPSGSSVLSGRLGLCVEHGGGSSPQCGEMDQRVRRVSLKASQSSGRVRFSSGQLDEGSDMM